MKGRAARVALRPAIALLLLAAAACADFEGATDPTHGLPDVAVADPDFAQHVVPIFERRCALGGCHSLATRQAGLVLTADSAYAALVGRPSAFRPQQLLVKPGDAANSWLIIMVSNDPRRAPFARMPLGSGPLTENQIATLVNWVQLGARGRG